ncbi:MAG: alpha/beta hydrolase, partial [Bryobacteraceae bacterium]
MNVVAIALVAAGIGQAAVPADVETKLLEMGRGVCVAGTALLYKPMQLKPPTGVKIERDIKYESDARTILDVFSAEKG